jgi:hypothetical protein
MKPKLVKSFEFPTSEAAWAGLNKYFLLREEEIVERGGVRSGTQLISNNIFMKIRKGYVSPDFDFAFMFGYKKQKWTRLIANYVNLNYLDLVKAEVLGRESKNQGNYNVSFIFDNAHVTGHGCLINLTFIRRAKTMYPILQFTLRSSEITKRLIFDFLLVQRMGEYVFGEGKHFGIEVFLPNAFTTSEGVIMMDNYFGINKTVDKWANEGNKPGPFLEKTLGILKRFKEVDVNSIKYKVHQRTVKQLQKVDGVPISNSPELKAKTLFIC